MPPRRRALTRFALDSFDKAARPVGLHVEFQRHRR